MSELSAPQASTIESLELVATRAATERGVPTASVHQLLLKNLETHVKNCAFAIWPVSGGVVNALYRRIFVLRLASNLRAITENRFSVPEGKTPNSSLHSSLLHETGVVKNAGVPRSLAVFRTQNTMRVTSAYINLFKIADEMFNVDDVNTFAYWMWSMIVPVDYDELTEPSVQSYIQRTHWQQAMLTKPFIGLDSKLFTINKDSKAELVDIVESCQLKASLLNAFKTVIRSTEKAWMTPASESISEENSLPIISFLTDLLLNKDPSTIQTQKNDKGRTIATPDIWNMAYRTACSLTRSLMPDFRLKAGNANGIPTAYDPLYHLQRGCEQTVLISGFNAVPTAPGLGEILVEDAISMPVGITKLPPNYEDGKAPPVIGLATTDDIPRPADYLPYEDNGLQNWAVKEGLYSAHKVAITTPFEIAEQLERGEYVDRPDGKPSTWYGNVPSVVSEIDLWPKHLGLDQKRSRILYAHWEEPHVTRHALWTWHDDQYVCVKPNVSSAETVKATGEWEQSKLKDISVHFGVSLVVPVAADPMSVTLATQLTKALKHVLEDALVGHQIKTSSYTQMNIVSKNPFGMVSEYANFVAGKDDLLKHFAMIPSEDMYRLFALSLRLEDLELDKTMHPYTHKKFWVSKKYKELLLSYFKIKMDRYELIAAGGRETLQEDICLALNGHTDSNFSWDMLVKFVLSLKGVERLLFLAYLEDRYCKGFEAIWEARAAGKRAVNEEVKADTTLPIVQHDIDAIRNQMSRYRKTATKKDSVE